MSKPTRILIVEDLASDFELAELEIRKSVKDCGFERVETRAGFLKALETFQPDVILSDYSLPNFDGLSALKLAKEQAPLTPFIIWTGSMSEDIAVECMKAGADNYILKENIKRLGSAVLHAMEERQLLLERKEAENKLHRSESNYRALAENSLQGIAIFQNQRIIYVNPAMCEIMGYTGEELQALTNDQILALTHPEDRAASQERARKRQANETVSAFNDVQIIRKDGTIRWIQTFITSIEYDGQPAILSTSVDVTKRRQAEENYQAIFANSADGIFQSTPDGRYLNANPALARIYGYDSPQEMIETVTDIAHQMYVDPDARKEFIGTFNTADSIANFEMKNYRRDGSIIWTSTSARAVRDADDNVLYYEGFLRDITERKQAEEKLRDSENRFSTIFHVSPIGICITRAPDGMVIDANNSFLEMMEYTREEALGHTTLELNLWEKLEERLRLLNILNEQGRVVNMDIGFRKKSGVVGQALISTELVDLAGTQCMLSLLTDITERRQAEQKYQDIFEHSREGIFQSTPDGRFIKVNPAMASIYGYDSPQDMIDSITGIAAQLYIEPGDRDEFTRLLQFNNHVENFEMANLRKDGSIIWTHTSARVVHDGSGNILYYEGFLQDVTERKLAEQALRKSQEDFQRYFNMNTIGMCITSPEKGWIEVNGRLCHMLGYSKEELKQLTWAELTHPDDLDADLLLFQQVLSGERDSYELDKSFVHRDGSRVYTTLYVTCHRQPDRSVGYIMASLIDITERNVAEIEIKQRNDDLRLINAINEAAIYGVSLDGIVNLLAKELKRIFSITGSTLYMLSPDGKSLTMQQYILSPELRRRIEKVIGSTIPLIEIPIREGGYFQKVLSKTQGTITSDPKEIQDWMAEFVETTFLPPAVRSTIRKLIPQIFKILNIKSAITVPLLSDGNTIGLLDISSPNPFTEDDLRRIEKISGQLTAAIQRQQANEQVRQSQEFLQSIQNALSASIAILNEEGVIVQVNSAWRKFGEQNDLQHPGYCVGLNYLDICDSATGQNAEEAQVVAQAIRDVIAGHRREVQVEYPCHSPEEKRWYTLRITKFDDGDHIWVVMAHENVTERKQAEESLKETSEQFRTLFDASPEGILLIEPRGDWRILDCNETAGTMNGYTRDELVEQSIDILTINRRDPKGRLEYLEQVRKAGVLRYDDYHRRKDGTIFPIAVSTSLITLGGREVILGIDRDITERKQAEEALRRAEKQLELFFSQSLDGFFFMMLDEPVRWDDTVDKEKVLDHVFEHQYVTRINKAMLEQYRAREEQFLGKTPTEFFAHDLAQGHQTWRQLFEEGRLHIETDERRFDGTQMWIEGDYICIYEDDGRIAGHFGVQRDVSERKKAEEALRESQALYRQAMEVAGTVPYYESYYDDNGRAIKYDFIGEGIRQITGYGPEEFTSKVWDSLVEEVNLVEELKGYSLDDGIQRVRSGENPVWKCEHRIRARDGSIHWVFEAAVELRDEHGVSYGSIGTYQDITVRKQAEQAEREQRALAEALRDTAETLNSTLDYGEVLDHILAAVGKVVPHDAAAILLIDRGIAHVARALGYEARGFRAEVMEIELSLTDAVNLRQILETGQPVVVPDTKTYPGWKKLPATEWLRSNVGAPISIHGEVVGFILLDSKTPEFFTSVHAERLKAFANQAALAIQNARLLKQAQEEIAERKQTEEALRESERRYRALFEDSPIAIWEEDFSMVKAYLEEVKNQGIVDMDAYLRAHPEIILTCIDRVKVVNVNKAALKLYESENKLEMLGELDKTYPKGSLTSFKDELVAISNNRPAFQTESTANTLRGNTRNVSVNWVVAPGSEQTYSKMLVSIVDITERKQAEKELNEEKEKAQKYLDIAGVMMLALDRDGNVSLINQKGCEILGYSNDEIVGKSWINNFTPESTRDEMQDVFQKLTREDAETSLYYENPVLTKNGEQRTIAWHNTLVRDENGRVVTSLSSGEDITERLRAEQELRASEERFRQLADNIQEVFWMTDAINGEELYISPAAEKIWGHSIKELMTSPNAFLESIYPEDIPAVQQMLEIQKLGQPTSMEYRTQRPDGALCWIWDRAFPVFDEAGQVVRMAGIAADITERKRVQEELRESETKYRGLFENLVIGFALHEIIVDDEGKPVDYVFLEINPMFEKLTGIHARDAIGRRVTEILPGIENERFIEIYGKVALTGEPVHLEEFSKPLNKYYEINAYSPKQGQFAVTFIDITERKLADDQLRKLSRAVEQGASTIVITDTSGNIEYVNPKFTETTGYTIEESRGQNPRILKSDHTTPEQYAQLWKTIISGEEWHGEFMNKKKNGELYWESATISPILNERNEITHFVAVKEEITERKRIEEEEQRHVTELEALYENGLAVGRLLNPREIGERVIATFARHLSWHHVTIRLIQPESDNLEMIAFNLPGLSEDEKSVAEQHFKSRISKVGQGMSGWVAQTGTPVRTGNVHEYPQYVDTQAGIQSGLYMPLKIGERVLGVISVESESPDAFTPQDERLLATLATQAAIAFENARLYQTNQLERERFSELFENSPIATWLEDFSAVISWMDGLRKQGVTNLKEYLEEDHESYKLGISLIDILDVNHAAVVMNGARDKDELLEKVHGLMMDETPSQIMIDELELIWRGYTSFGFEMSSQKLDGSTITGIQRIYIPIANNEPDYGSVIVTNTDITDRVDVETRLRNSEVHYRELADSITDVFFELDQDLRLSHWNKASEILTGFSAEHAIGRSMLEVFGESFGLGRIEQVFSEVREKHQPRTFETIIPLNNQSRTFEINVYPSTRGAVVVAKDVTERKLSESLMQKRFELMEYSGEHRLEELMQKALDEISEWTHSTIGFFQFIQEDQLTPSLQVWSTDTFQHFHSSDVEEMHTSANQAGVWAEAIRQRRAVIQNDYASLPGKKGQPEGHASLVRELVVPIIRNERIVAVIGIGNKPQEYTRDDLERMERFADYAWDVIERKQMVTELAEERNQLAKRVEERTSDLSRANSNLARALRVKDEFLASMSHELRTPLNAILGLSESLGEQIAGPLNEKQQRYLTTISESGHHLLSLINDILDLAKIEAGQITLDINKVDVNLVSQASLRMIKQLAQKKNLDVAVEIDEKIGLMWADERRLKQMMVNLLSNAVKFTPEDGKLGLQIVGDQDENKVSITVWDTGIGIKESDFQRLFQPFVQLDAGLAREASGTGLGLALVSQMARLHGGSVNVTSEPGQGSRFTIVLPWQPAQAMTIAEKMKVTGKLRTVKEGQGPQTILLVEDTQEVVMMIKDYLEIAGYKVVTAQDGLDGITQARLSHPNLILMDVQMPRMDGLEATQKLRLDPEFKQTPILALTALAMPNDRERCLAAGMDEYISKPVNLRALVKIIQSCLSIREEKTLPR